MSLRYSLYAAVFNVLEVERCVTLAYSLDSRISIKVGQLSTKHRMLSKLCHFTTIAVINNFNFILQTQPHATNLFYPIPTKLIVVRKMFMCIGFLIFFILLNYFKSLDK